MMTTSAMGLALRGRAILVTRPAHQAEPLARLIEDRGGDPVRFPALAIAPPSVPWVAKQALGRLASFDLAIFVSANAVDSGLALLGGPWPQSVVAAAMGEGTAAALHRHGVGGVVVSAAGADSESLLCSDRLQNVRGRRVLILRGEGGRELLADELRRRGAMVEYAQCYRRVRPATDPAPLIARWQQGAIHAVTVMSGQTLDNLFTMLGPAGQALLRATPLFAPHSSIVARARSAGIGQAVVTAPGDGGVLQAMAEWFRLAGR